MNRSIPEATEGENADADAAVRGALLVLDFDGVLCDSLPECYVSSWHAHRASLSAPHPAVESGGAFGRFTTLRHFVRSGEDYLLIHEAEERGLEVRDQPSFDALIAAAGPEGMADRKRRLYRTREQLIRTEPEYWLRLSPIYPHLVDVLPRIAANPAVHILSTKRSDLVARIVAARGVEFPPERIHAPGVRDKLDVVLELASDARAGGALFVDDQVDYFRDASKRARGVDCRLAAWGYVQQEWLHGSPDYRVLAAREAVELFLRWRSRP